MPGRASVVEFPRTVTPGFLGHPHNNGPGGDGTGPPGNANSWGGARGAPPPRPGVVTEGRRPTVRDREATRVCGTRATRVNEWPGC
jgi:hypothetical protein